MMVRSCPTLFFLLVLLVSSHLQAQSLHWITIKEKELPDTSRLAVSSQARLHRLLAGLPEYQISDYPPAASCLDSLRSLGIQVRTVSKWLNAASAYLTRLQVQQLPNVCSCVDSIFPAGPDLVPAYTRQPVFPNNQSVLYPSLRQMQPDILFQRKWDAEGLIIGVIDAGFAETDSNELLQHFQQRNAFLHTRDFVSPEWKGSFFTNHTPLDFHGTWVLMCIGGKNEQLQMGLATGANFVLARTDHGTRESRMEEDYWIQAVEWMDSLGIRLINTSLGYADDFDNPAENYLPEQMNGSFSAIARAADRASREKGMLLVVSAGNEGDEKKWRVISTPADAPGVLSVGAVDLDGLRQSYSSIGPENNQNLKPEISAFSNEGTSFSAPVITGLAACLWAEYPTLTNQDLKSIIIQSGHLYPSGNNYIGYGVPNVNRAVELLESEGKKPQTLEVIEAKGKKVKLSISGNFTFASVFHLREPWVVMSQKKMPIAGSTVRIVRPAGCSRTVVSAGFSRPVEIRWVKKASN